MTRTFLRSPGFRTDAETAEWAKQNNVAVFVSELWTPDGRIRGSGEVESAPKPDDSSEAQP